MPLPDNHSSSAFNRVWGRDKIMPRELNRDECRTIAVQSSMKSLLMEAIRKINDLPKAPLEVSWGTAYVIKGIEGEIAGIDASIEEIREIPKLEADEANDMADMDV